MKVESLRRVRVGRQLSTRELAVLAGLDRKTVEGIEAGRVSPRFRTMRSIAMALGVSESAISEFAGALRRAAQGKG